jgi:signal transduction histidine kinase
MGVGLGATRERLRKMYPGTHEIAMPSADDGGTEVRVVLPFHTTETRFAGVPA